MSWHSSTCITCSSINKAAVRRHPAWCVAAADCNQRISLVPAVGGDRCRHLEVVAPAVDLPQVSISTQENSLLRFRERTLLRRNRRNDFGDSRRAAPSVSAVLPGRLTKAFQPCQIFRRENQPKVSVVSRNAHRGRLCWRIDADQRHRHGPGMGPRQGRSLPEGEHESLEERCSRHQDHRTDMRRPERRLHKPPAGTHAPSHQGCASKRAPPETRSCW